MFSLSEKKQIYATDYIPIYLLHIDVFEAEIIFRYGQASSLDRRAIAKNKNSASEMHISISKIFYRERFARKLRTRREGLTNREAPSQQLFPGSTSAIYSRLFFCQFQLHQPFVRGCFCRERTLLHGCGQRMCIRIFAGGK